ncbi:MAG: hypothetical protein PHE26_07835 [Syntrophomonadaceae bacterium]|nr:hypothetical protein [Syntrophomonadaceae bacterium]
MDKYWEQVENRDDIERGMFVILPLKYDLGANFKDMSIIGNQPIPFESSDFMEILVNKCSLDEDFVRRYKLDVSLDRIQSDTEISITDLQLFVFNNGIAFLSAYLSYSNGNVGSIYKFIYPGYTDENEELKSVQALFLQNLSDKFLNQLNLRMRWFITNKKSQSFILKEAYRLNVAYVPNRFKETDLINKITYNEHRIIDLSRDFEDLSEKDVEYVTGARDVDSEDYGWGCSITSQEISYAYAKGNVPLVERASDDFLLTMLVMYQKYTCIQLNEEIHHRYIAKNKAATLKKSIRDLKREAMEFIAYGTLASSQISRWNNVCDTYRLLIELNGINETIAEIKEKINLLNEEQERIDSKRESTIGMIIAVFGFVSIIGATLQIVDYVSTGRTEILVSFVITIAAVLGFGAFLIRMLLTKKKRNGDV